jgi:hypothetical protein
MDGRDKPGHGVGEHREGGQSSKHNIFNRLLDAQPSRGMTIKGRLLQPKSNVL